MKTRTLMASLIVATLATAGVAQANPGQGGPGNGQGPQHQQGQGGPQGHGNGHDPRQEQGEPGNGRGGPPNWHEGDHVPDRYRGEGHWVQDWRGHDLPEPPHGHRWLEIDGDYVLAAVATGVITSIILGH
ncbi:RcnB family protein [Salinicola avicenniae]|uniref:RcnB family protein n=1 Tax=Salinicola avicenniae TaxID=2916836 RepID=UPI002072B3EF|nr:MULTISPECIES: RcnB family protein [unclassified Salinicola]